MKWIFRLFGNHDAKTSASQQSRPLDASDVLPIFRYHPNPVATGSFKASDATCPCCQRVRGCEYVASVYCAGEAQGLCPWCIADGSAARKFDAMFSDDYPLLEAGVTQETVDIVTKRTPGYISWQQENWLSCCGDACAFHGDISREELLGLPETVLAKLNADHPLPEDHFREIMDNYQPGGGPAIYKFVCLHCGQVRLDIDFA